MALELEDQMLQPGRLRLRQDGRKTKLLPFRFGCEWPLSCWGPRVGVLLPQLCSRLSSSDQHAQGGFGQGVGADGSDSGGDLTRRVGMTPMKGMA